MDPDQEKTVCSPNGLGFYQCHQGTYCGNLYRFAGVADGDVLDEGFINYGVLTFDNIGKALLSVFQIVTNDNWALTMYNLMNTDIIAAVSPLYFCFLVVFGSFFLLNIILAVILDSFIRVQQEDMERLFASKSQSLPPKELVHEELQVKLIHAEEESKAAQDLLEEEVFTSENFNEPEPEMMGRQISIEQKAAIE